MKNLKTVSIFIVLVITLTMLAACGSDPIANELKSYVNEKLPDIQTLESKAGDAYNAVSGDNYTDDATMLAALNDSVLTASNDALEAAKKLAPVEKEVAALNDQYVTALTSYNNGYKALQEALTNGDASKADETITLFATAETQKADFMAAVTALGKDHGVTIKTK